MIRIVEVAPRDGLQNETTPIPTPAKIQFINDLERAGLREIEIASFVSPKWVPQLGDAAEVVSGLERATVGRSLVLIPNMKGLERAIQCGVKRIAVFTAASEAFTQNNINMSIDESLAVFSEVLTRHRDGGGTFARGYISTAFECPYEGKIEPAAVVRVAQKLLELGVDEISIGDTTGVAVPKEVRYLTEALAGVCPLNKLTFHFHDTRGTAIANVAAALEAGITSFDSSAAGLGGCPYAPGAGGNLATEDLVYFLERTGMETGVNAEALAKASLPILNLLGRTPAAKSQLATLAACRS